MMNKKLDTALDNEKDVADSLKKEVPVEEVSSKLKQFLDKVEKFGLYNFKFSGGRKTSMCQLQLGDIGKYKDTINGKHILDFFKLPYDSNKIYEIIRCQSDDSTVLPFSFKSKIEGGGTTGQSDAFRHTMSKALMTWLYFKNREIFFATKKNLKRKGFLTRDNRYCFSKLPGRVKSRKMGQRSKR